MPQMSIYSSKPSAKISYKKRDKPNTPKNSKNKINYNKKIYQLENHQNHFSPNVAE
jgi:hypothetical protein